MKNLLLFGCITILLGTAAAQANRHTVKGSVNDENGRGIAYSTIIAKSTQDTTIVFGAVSDEKGLFTLTTPAGEYSLTATFVGYNPYNKVIRVEQATVLPAITLTENVITMESAVITASAIRRRADGFVVNMQNSGVAKGRNTLEALAFAPGVMTHNGITINGRGGTVVYVNNRKLNMSGKELEAYLQSIPAEDILSMEIIPVAGSEYDASATGGVLKLTLRRQNTGGYYGSITAQGGWSPFGFGVKHSGLSGNINYRKNRLSLYASAGVSQWNHHQNMDEHTTYTTLPLDNLYTAKLKNNNNSAFAQLNAVYDLTDNQSLGVVFDFYNYDNSMSSDGHSTLTTNNIPFTTDTEYRQKSKGDNFSGSLDYNLKIGSKGATFQSNIDFTRNSSTTNDKFTSIVPLSSAFEPNRAYTNDLTAPANVFNIKADFKAPLSEKITLKSGAKFYTMNLENDILYKDFIGGQWVVNKDFTEIFSYNEKVAALYGELAASFGKLNVTAGVRAENTAINIRSNKPNGDLTKNYTDLFPSLSVMYQQNKDKGHSLTLNANQKISRPSFAQLRPFTSPISEYAIVVGNPLLLPTTMTTLSLTQTLFNKYSFTIQAEHSRNPIAEISTIDPNDPRYFIYKHVNMDARMEYTAVAYAPVEVNEWWSITLNAIVLNRQESYLNSANKLTTDIQITPVVVINNTFKFGQGFQAGVSGQYVGKAIQGNLEVSQSYYVNLRLSKSLFDEKLSITMSYNGLIQSRQRITVNDPAYFKVNDQIQNDRYLRLTLRYNFRHGEKVNVKKATSGNAQESGRL